MEQTEWCGNNPCDKNCKLDSNTDLTPKYGWWSKCTRGCKD